MTKEEIFMQLDNQLSKVERASQKAKIMTDDLTEDYFSDEADEADGVLLMLGYEKAQIKLEIVTSYLDKLENELDKLRELVNNLQEEK